MNFINLENQVSKKLERDFFSDETHNFDFYEDSSSVYLDERKLRIQKIKDYFGTLQESSELRSPTLQKKIKSAIASFNAYEKIFDQIVDLIIARGFKDYGIEGEMRTYVHAIEDITPKFRLDLGKLLMIRRHEKDFILRKQDQYIDKIKVAIDALRGDISYKVYQRPMIDSLNHLLDLYQGTFLRLVNTEKEIGFNNDTGLRKKLTSISTDIENSINDINQIISKKINSIRSTNRIILVVTVVISILLIIFLAFLITRILSKPVQTLSKSINQVIQSNFSRKVDFNIIPSRDEIGVLSRDFAYMLARMQDSLDEIRSKSEKIEKKQKQLMDSIQYAQKIQQAILPDVLEMSECFEDHFVIYYPMHIVSGDFYWLTRLGDEIFFAVVDCTGHGVPGAFMSMIGHTLLNEIINEKGIRDPALVLEMLDAEVRASLKQGQNRNQDGMEVALCRIGGLIKAQPSIDITFAGAKGTLFYNQLGEVERVRGTRRGIGGLNPIDPDNLEHFENVEIHLAKGDSIYLGSDGFVDQPNHRRKSFGNKRLKKYLKEVKDLGMSTQKKILTDALYQHMGKKATLRDDVTLVGLRF